jgi:DNA-binding transcriptional regulator YbjK
MKSAILEKDTRSAILATGQAIMSHKGFSAVGLTEILTAAGVPKGSFYHYLPRRTPLAKRCWPPISRITLARSTRSWPGPA